MKKHSLLTWLVILIALLPVGYLALIWDTLPEIIPTRFDSDMKPDRMDNKSELWVSTGIMAVVSVAVYFLIKNLHRIDPKRKGMQTNSTFNKLAAGLVVFIAALNFIIIYSAKGTIVMQNLLFPLLGLLLAFIGNYMHNIKPNYFAGIRLPWTLSSDENWRRTHQLGGKLWFAGGLTIALVSLFLPATFMMPVFIGVVLVMIIVPAVYSYRLFKQNI